MAARAKPSDYRGLVSAQFEAQDVRANVRTRPATTATVKSQKNVKDGNTSILNFSPVLWKTCQGTWSGSSCITDLPACAECD